MNSSNEVKETISTDDIARFIHDLSPNKIRKMIISSFPHVFSYTVQEDLKNWLKQIYLAERTHHNLPIDNKANRKYLLRVTPLLSTDNRSKRLIAYIASLSSTFS